MTKYPPSRINGFKLRWPKWTDEERFLTHVKKTETCWFWQGAIHSKKGYGSFLLKGKTGKAHRAAWFIFKGDIPHGMFVCHHCDNPSCVNPDHLFLGTHRDNMNDMINKGRSSLCAHTKNKKFKPEDIRKIRNDTRDTRSIANSYRVHVRTIRRIKTHKIYIDVSI